MYELASWAISQCSGKLELNIAKKDIRMTFAKSNKDLPLALFAINIWVLLIITIFITFFN